MLARPVRKPEREGRLTQRAVTFGLGDRVAQIRVSIVFVVEVVDGNPSNAIFGQFIGRLGIVGQVV